MVDIKHENRQRSKYVDDFFSFFFLQFFGSFPHGLWKLLGKTTSYDWLYEKTFRRNTFFTPSQIQKNK